MYRAMYRSLFGPLGAEHTTVHRPVHSEISDVLERIRSLDGIFRTISYIPDVLKEELRGPLNPQRHNRFANESIVWTEPTLHFYLRKETLANQSAHRCHVTKERAGAYLLPQCVLNGMIAYFVT